MHSTSNGPTALQASSTGRSSTTRGGSARYVRGLMVRLAVWLSITTTGAVLSYLLAGNASVAFSASFATATFLGISGMTPRRSNGGPRISGILRRGQF